ncbi:hypothetical protein JCM8097_006748 [Rhodosporidiobolus ruineniae]
MDQASGSGSHSNPRQAFNDERLRPLLKTLSASVTALNAAHTSPASFGSSTSLPLKQYGNDESSRVAGVEAGDWGVDLVLEVLRRTTEYEREVEHFEAWLDWLNMAVRTVRRNITLGASLVEPNPFSGIFGRLSTPALQPLDSPAVSRHSSPVVHRPPLPPAAQHSPPPAPPPPAATGPAPTASGTAFPDPAPRVEGAARKGKGRAAESSSVVPLKRTQVEDEKEREDEEEYGSRRKRGRSAAPAPVLSDPSREEKVKVKEVDEPLTGGGAAGGTKGDEGGDESDLSELDDEDDEKGGADEHEEEDTDAGEPERPEIGGNRQETFSRGTSEGPYLPERNWACLKPDFNLFTLPVEGNAETQGRYVVFVGRLLKANQLLAALETDYHAEKTVPGIQVFSYAGTGDWRYSGRYVLAYDGASDTSDAEPLPRGPGAWERLHPRLQYIFEQHASEDSTSAELLQSWGFRARTFAAAKAEMEREEKKGERLVMRYIVLRCDGFDEECYAVWEGKKRAGK